MPNDTVDCRDESQIVVLFGSQAGAASDAAHWLSSKLRQITPKVSCDIANSYSNLPLRTDSVYVFVTSTSGNGEFPLNASRFWVSLREKSAARRVQKGIKYAVFGLGDSKYSQFNYAARKLFGRMSDLGGVPLCQLGCGDDQHSLGYSQEFIPWVSLLWTGLFGTEFSADSRVSSVPRVMMDLKVPGSAPGCAARLSRTRRLTSESHFQEIREFQFELVGNWNFEAGDVLAVLPKVSSAVVLNFISHVLLEDPERSIMGFSLKRLFTEILDITAVPSHLFYEILYQSYVNQVSGRETTAEEIQILQKLSTLASFTPEGANERLRYSARERMSVLEVLQDFHQVRVPLQSLVSCLPHISPRYYSLSCPAKTEKRYLLSSKSRIPITKVEIVVGMVDYTTLLGRRRIGLASEYLRSLQVGSVVQDRIWLERGFNSDLNVSIKAAGALLLFGPGTGMAPLRGIVLSEKNQNKSMMIFSGFRNKESDFLFHEDFRNCFGSNRVQVYIGWSRPRLMDRNLTWCWTGFNRADLEQGPGSESGRKTWVQDLMEIKRLELQKFLYSNFSTLLIVIAGRSHPMPLQIFEALESILGEERVNTLSRQNRIVYDTWG